MFGILFSVFFTASLTSAATVTWIAGGSGDWNDATKYEGGIAPAAGDTIVYSGGTNSVNSLQETATPVSATGGNTTFGGNLYISNNAPFTVNNPGEAADTPTIYVKSTLRIGSESGSGTAVLNLEAGTMKTNSWVAFGREGKGVLNLSGGTFQAVGGMAFLLGDKYYDDASGKHSVGEIQQSGGTLSTSLQTKFASERNAVGYYNMTGGTANITGEFLLGAGVNSSGTIDINGAAAVMTVKNLKIGAASGASGVVNVTSGTLDATGTDASITVGQNSAAKKAELNVNGGTLNALNLNVYNSGIVNLSGGTANITNLNTYNSGVLNVSGGANTVTALLAYGNSTVNLTGGTNKITSVLTLRDSAVCNIDGGSVTCSQINISNYGTMNIRGGSTVTTTGTFRTGSYAGDVFLNGHAVLNIIDGEFIAQSWVGHGFKQNSTSINIYSGGKMTHTNAGAFFPVGDNGGTADITLYKGGTLKSAKITFTDLTALNFVPTAAENWNVDTGSLTFGSGTKLTFGDVNGITAFSDKAYSIVIPNASGTPTVVQNPYWTVNYDAGGKTLTASLKESALTWTSDMGLSIATLENGVSGIADLSDTKADADGNYNFTLFLHGDGDKNALADFFTESLALFTGMDENGTFTSNEGLGTLTYSGKVPLPDYFYWDLGAYNLANGTSFNIGGVPEPASCILLLVGLSFLGAIRSISAFQKKTGRK